MTHPLETLLRKAIHTDTRPTNVQRYSQRTGLKRTQIIDAKVIPVGAAPVKQITQTTVANMGNSAWAKFMSGPLLPEAINQGVLSDCYLLIAMDAIARKRPLFFNDIFVQVDEQTVVNQWFWQGVIVQITTSLLISTDYNHPLNGDPRPEIAEKTWGLLRSGISDYTKDNLGFVFQVFQAFGLDAITGTMNFDAIAAAIQAGKAVGLSTTTTATGSNSLEPWVQNHAYDVVAIDTVKREATLAQPWHPSQLITGVSAATLEDPNLFNMLHIGTFPATPRLQAGMVQLAPPTPNPPNDQVNPQNPPVAPPPPTPTEVPTMPAPAVTLIPDRDSAHEWDAVTLRWTSTGATTVVLNGTPAALSGARVVQMPASDYTATLIATSADGVSTVMSVTVKLIPNAPAPVTPTKTPAFICFTDGTWSKA